MKGELEIQSDDQRIINSFKLKNYFPQKLAKIAKKIRKKIMTKIMINGTRGRKIIFYQQTL